MKPFTYSVFLALILLFLIGCKGSTIYVPIETVKTEYQDRWVKDSIYWYDSIFVKEKNDTIWLEKYQIRYRDKLIRDSVYICDSIQVPYAVVEYREVNRLSQWQIVLMCLGGVLIGYLGLKVVRYFK